MLPSGAGARPRLEAAVPASQPPGDLSAAWVYVVDRPRVARRYQRGAVRIEVERVDVEEVKRRARRGGARRHVGLAQADVVEAGPFVHHQARAHVDLLEDPVGRSEEHTSELQSLR